MSIDLADGKSAPFGPIYSLSVKEEKVLKDYIEGALAAGIIRESRSSAGAPVMFVPKSDGGLRLCVDYRGLNNVTKTNRTALPIIRDMLFRANGSKYFSKIDLKSAFNLIRIMEGHEFLTAFRTKYGHFEYLVMPFGLKNAPGTFQGLMNSIFGDLIDRGVLVYIDDLLLYSVSEEEHRRLLKEVFKRLRSHNLKVNPKKCSFYCSEVNFLGHVISENGVKMDAKKLDSIKNWEPPKNVKELQSFLGLCNYYRDFIPRFASIAVPLYVLTKKDTVYTWTEESQKSFEEIKSAFLSDQVLIQPDTAKQFFLECDASDYAIGAVLSQQDDEGNLRPIGFYSRKFSAAEVNYEIYDKELLAIIEGLKNWRHYCIGTELPVKIFTDHNNLRYFMSSRQLNRRQARWSLFLADYNFEIIVRPGTQQIVSDILSRQEQMQIRPDDEEYRINEQILLTQDKFLAKERSSDVVSTLTLGASLVSPVENSDSESDGENTDYDITRDHYSFSSGSDLSDSEVYGDLEQLMEIEGQQDNSDPYWFQLMLRYLWYGDLPMVLAPPVLKAIKVNSRNYTFKDDRLFKKIHRNGHEYHARYIPSVNRKEIIIQYHQTLGHMQCSTMLPILEVRFYWPTMEKDLISYQSSCPECQMNRTGEHSFRPLHPHEPVGMPFAKWGIDFVQDLPETLEGFKNVFSAKCYATKTVIFVKTKDRTAKTAARCIFENIVCRFGVPLEIVSDRATSFLDQTLQEYLKILEISHLPTSSYTPRSNGSVERIHRELKGILTKLCDGNVHKWDQYLSQAEFILNIRVNNSTGFSPFYLSHGIEARLPGDDIPAVPPGYYDLNDAGDVATLSARELSSLGQHRAAALQRLKVQAARMKRQYDNKVGVSDFQFHFGDIVKLKNNSSGKFESKYVGPFYVVDSGPNSTYFLQRFNGRRWTDQAGRDIPVNSEFLSPFNVGDDEIYSD